MFDPIVKTGFRSPNFDSTEIPVEFLVLHYTACTLERTLEIFLDPQSKKCAHFVVAEDGSIRDLGDFLNGPIKQGAHAGESYFKSTSTDEEFHGFNRFSIGVELVNLNGNIRPYTELQYQALSFLIGYLKERFPKLKDPDRIVGHEHIAGHRGKADPGRQFDWPRLFKEVYAITSYPKRPPLCSEEQAEKLMSVVSTKTDQFENPLFWSRLSAELETSLRGK